MRHTRRGQSRANGATIEAVVQDLCDVRKETAQMIVATNKLRETLEEKMTGMTDRLEEIVGLMREGMEESGRVRDEMKQTQAEIRDSARALRERPA